MTGSVIRFGSRRLLMWVMIAALSASVSVVEAQSASEPWRIRPAEGEVVLDGRIDEFAWEHALEVRLLSLIHI